jgi:DNA-binding transcriptional regulator YdaS (Cro superfamily)
MATRKGRAPGIAIQAYLEKHRLSQKDFATRVGVTQGAVSQWIKGKTRIDEERGAVIIKVTEGEVSAADLFPRLFVERAA